MFKALLLQGWYNLSDQQLESQLARDLLFRCFVGIGIGLGSSRASNGVVSLIRSVGLIGSIFITVFYYKVFYGKQKKTMKMVK